MINTNINSISLFRANRSIKNHLMSYFKKPNKHTGLGVPAIIGAKH